MSLNTVPAAARVAVGLRNPGGLVPEPDFGSALIAVGVWQAVFFIVPARLAGQHHQPSRPP